MIAALDTMRAFNLERRLNRILAKRAKLAASREFLVRELTALDHLDEGLSNREGDLIEAIDVSEVFA